MMNSATIIPYKYGISWALKERRNVIIVSSSSIEKPAIENSKIIYKISELVGVNVDSDNIIIANLIEWDVTDQKRLVRYINDHVGDPVVIIGIIPDLDDGRSRIIDWLLHKFWICCDDEDEDVEQPHGSTVHINHSLVQYIKDLMIHMRMHRLVVQGNGGGVHTGTLKDVMLLSQCIANGLHGRDYVIPEDVKQAWHWYMPWHLRVLGQDQWDQDPSLLYGSKPQYVQQYFATAASAAATAVRTPLARERLIAGDVLKKVVPPI
ncbi:maintenance of telomere capping protein 2 [Monosporozyma servazzii]